MRSTIEKTPAANSHHDCGADTLLGICQIPYSCFQREEDSGAHAFVLWALSPVFQSIMFTG